MIKYILATMLTLVMITGCAVKEPTVVIKKEFVYEKPYRFSTIDLDGVYIDLGSEELRRVCSPALVELNTIYKGVTKFYEDQIIRYKEGRSDDKSGHKTSN